MPGSGSRYGVFIMLNEYQIVGPPGCGKTTTLTRQIEHSTHEYGYDRVLVTSLTKTAAHELTDRVTTIDTRNIGTLHSVCYRLLDRPELAETRIADWNEKNPQHAMNGINTDEDEVAIRDYQTDEVWGVIELLRQRMIPEDNWPGQVLKVYDKYREWKGNNNLMDFTDFIENAIDIVPDVDVIIADEAQDYSRLELKLLRSWAAQTEKLIIAGDPDQVLYHWRGADPDLFREGHSGRKVLKQSYRVPEAVHAKAVEWIHQISDREEFEYLPTGEKGFVKSSPNTLKYFNVNEMMKLPGKKMILATCGYMLQNIISVLRAKGIPFWNPYRFKAGNWNPIRRQTTDRLKNFLKEQKTMGELWSAVEHMRKEFLQYGAKAKLNAKENKMIPINQFNEFEYYSDKGLELETPLDWFDALNKTKQKAWRYLRTVVEKHGVDELFKEPEIIVGTVHSVKGGEADYVYLLPDLSKKAASSVYTKEGKESMIRTFYVGMTRAKKGLFLCRGSNSSSSAVWS